MYPALLFFLYWGSGGPAWLLFVGCCRTCILIAWSVLCGKPWVKDWIVSDKMGKKKEGWGETKRRGEREGMGGERGEEITWVWTNSGKLNMSNVFKNRVWYEDFPAGSAVKNLPANARDAGSSLGMEDPLEKEMATHSSILAWGTSTDRQLPLGWQRVRHHLGTKQ